MKKIILPVLSCVLLSACGQNSLEKNTQDKDGINQVVAASYDANKELNIETKDGGAYAYSLCMENKAKKKQPLCSKLYKGMAEELNKKPGFSHVTAGQLKSFSFYRRIRQTYKGLAFDYVEY